MSGMVISTLQARNQRPREVKWLTVTQNDLVMLGFKFQSISFQKPRLSDSYYITLSSNNKCGFFILTLFLFFLNKCVFESYRIQCFTKRNMVQESEEYFWKTITFSFLIYIRFIKSNIGYLDNSSMGKHLFQKVSKIQYWYMVWIGFIPAHLEHDQQT